MVCRKNLRKILSAVIFRILATFLLIGICLQMLIQFFSCTLAHDTTDIAKELSPDGKYIAILQTHGEPVSFGPTPLRITVQTADGAVLKQMDTSVAHDGCCLTASNRTVEWEQTCVLITLHGDEQLDETLQFPLSENQIPRSNYKSTA